MIDEMSVVCRGVRFHSGGVCRVPRLIARLYATAGARALLRNFVAQRMRTRRHVACAPLQLTRRSVHLHRNRREFVRVLLHGFDQHGQIIEHAVVAALEKAQLIGVARVRTRVQITALHLRHALTCATNARNQARRHLNDLLRDHQQQNRGQQHLRPRRRISWSRVRVAPTRNQKTRR